MEDVIKQRLKKILQGVHNPGRYTGGELGMQLKDEADYRMALSFPDLYEIGMSNQAVRMLYSRINSMDGISCERVFAPDQDFEEALKKEGISLYGLESERPLGDFDLIGISIGFELCLTALLSILDTGKVPLKTKDRRLGDPIVIAGGPAITNPAPFGLFLDAVFIGEAEGVLPEVLNKLRKVKLAGGDREAQLEIIRSSEGFWFPGKTETTRRVIWEDFGKEPSSRLMPVPSIKPVQDHGVVEIMRGCPNGCRFCHAGIFYRQQRIKDPVVIFQEIERQVYEGGYRQITLSSLSTGDYPQITEMIRLLNSYWGPKGISFNLPSLRVNSLTLPLLSEIGSLRKSGLTFALETPRSEGQRGINKDVPIDRVIELLREAKSLGWRLAKFYFMVGLPVAGESDESEEIIELLLRIKRETGMNLNVNIGTFVPKPHTPYQWDAQLSETESLKRIMEVKNRVKRQGIKVGYHSPFTSFLEGLITRGDERVGEIFLEAYRRGARLEAWDDRVDRDLWRDVLKDHGPLMDAIMSAQDPEGDLPWADISLGVSNRFLKEERRKSDAGELTSLCETDCSHPCGVCGKNHQLTNTVDIEPLRQLIERKMGENTRSPVPGRSKLVFCYEKTGPAIWWSHLTIMHLFERAFFIIDMPIKHTEGFNPKPKLEFASPLPLGFNAKGDIGAVELIIDQPPLDDWQHRLDEALPNGLAIKGLKEMPIPSDNRKFPSVMSLYSGAEYLLDFGEKNRTLYEGIDRYLKEFLSTETVEIQREAEDRIRLLLPQTGKKSNIKTILSTVIGEDWLTAGIAVTRMRCFQRKEGKGPLVPYFTDEELHTTE